MIYSNFSYYYQSSSIAWVLAVMIEVLTLTTIRIHITIHHLLVSSQDTLLWTAIITLAAIAYSIVLRITVAISITTIFQSVTVITPTIIISVMEVITIMLLLPLQSPIKEYNSSREIFHAVSASFGSSFSIHWEHLMDAIGLKFFFSILDYSLPTSSTAVTSQQH